MRFLEVDLRDYGPFSNARPLALDRGDRGLHLIHGPNEAGKSTALRALRTLLFGFPKSTGDNHGRDYAALRIGGTIQDESGRKISFVRRKRDLSPLWTFDDAEALAPDTLVPFLGGLDLEKFRDLFSMDHAELVVGGQAILKGGGRLGEMLFAAGSGLAPVAEVRKKLDEEMDRLFRPRASTPSINSALAELTERRRASEKATLATTDWVDLDATLARERARKEAIDLEIRRADAEKRRLERVRDALPVLARLDGVLATLAGFGDAPVLSDGFADRRRDAEFARSAGARAARSAEEALEAVARDLEALGPRDPVLDEADAIRRLRDDLGLYRKAVEDRPVDENRLARRQADAQALLVELRPGGSLEDAPALKISAPLRGRVQGLIEELAALQASRSNAEADVARLLAASPGLDRKPASAEAPRLAEALAEALRRAQAQGDLEAQLAATLAELAKLERQAAIDLQALPLWSGSLEDLEASAVPSKATLARFEKEFREADESLSRLDLDLTRLVDEQARLVRQNEREQAADQVPTDEELAARRGSRDENWRRIRRAWLDREPVEAPGRLADDFEAAVRSSDGLADRLRSEADNVAKLAQRRGRLRELADEIASKTDARDRARTDRAAVERAWQTTWSPLGLDPLPPSEMKEWVADHRAELLRQARVLREKRLEHDQKAAKIDELRGEIGHHLVGLGEAAVAATETLAALLARARSTVEWVNTASRMAQARDSLARADAMLADARARWASAIEPLGLDAEASPALAQAIIARFDDLAGILREVSELRGKLEDRDRVEARFTASVHGLLERLEIAPTTASLEATAVELDDRLKRAVVVATQRDEAIKREQRERSKLKEAHDGVDLAIAALDALMVEAGVGSTEDLIEAERTSNAIQERTRELRSLEEQLATLAGPVPVATLREQAEGADSETLEARIAELAERLIPLSSERDRLAEEIGRCRLKLEAMDGGPAAADAQQLVEERVAHLAVDVERYARLRLASAILREAVERYRKEHQGPVLDRAGALFASLTAGSFGNLRADLDEKGEPVLLGVRADGSTLLKVDAMSEGTADQLYLALRLASLQTYLDDHEPMPLVVDDILVNFDNARALAALRALADLSKRTQVLFFTHHEHLVDLARSALPDDVLFVHRLDFPPVSLAVNGEHSESVKPKRKKKAPSLLGEE